MRAAPSAVPSPGSTAGSKPEPVELRFERVQAAPGPGPAAGLDTPRVAGVGGVVGVGADPLGQRGEQARRAARARAGRSRGPGAPAARK